MRTVSLRLADVSRTSIPIGYEGEQNHTRVIFYCAQIFDDYPDAVATMVIKPATGDAYPQTVTKSGRTIIWDVTPSNVYGAGSGTYQFTFIQGEEIIKSIIGSFSVNASIIGNGEAPDPVTDWVNEANEVLANIPNTINEAVDDALEEAKESGDFKGDPGEPGAKGDKGDPGEPAPASAVAEAVDDYLEENFSNPSNPPLDRTLTSGLSAAPADIVGNLKNAIDSVEDEIGNTPMGTTATTITGAIAEHEADISAETARATASEAMKVSKPTTSPNGTSGQLLRTNGDGTTTWVDEGLPTDEQTAEAVSDWLDDHPEATTTVQDGSITKAKLNSSLIGELDDKAPAIIIETEKKNKFTKQETTLKHLGDAYVDGESGEGVVIGFGENIMPDINNETVATGTTFTRTVHQNGVVELSGYMESTKTLYLHKYGSTTAGELTFENEIESGSVITFCAYIKGSAVKTGGSYTVPIKSMAKFHYTDGTNSDTINLDTSEGLNTVSFTVPSDKTADQVTVTFSVRFGWTFNCSISFGMLLNGEWTAYTLPESGTMSFNKEQIANGFVSLPYKSYLKYVADTKDYIDDHMPTGVVTFDDLEEYEPTLANQHYLTPEMYGAKGDGTTDDTLAFQACISDAVTNRIPLKAFGIYKTTQTLTFAQSPSNAGRNYSYEINRINYTGTDDYAVEINGSYGRFIFGIVSSNQGGIHLASVVNEASNNYIFANRVNADATCFFAEGISGGVYYNTIRILKAVSANGNCFENGDRSGENRYYDTSCTATNGWGIYGCNGRYYNFCLEGNVKNGIRTKTGDAGNLICFRWAELMNHYEEGVSGTVLKVVGDGVFLRIIGPEIQLRCIDVSEMTKKEDVAYGVYATKGIILTASVVNSTGYRHLGQEAHIRVGKIICMPEIKASKYVVDTATVDLRGNDPPGYPTKFIIDTDDSVIHLSDSYCTIGYNEIIVDQSQGNTCTIYKSDDDVTPIFDGAQEGTGVFKLTAYCEPSQDKSIVYRTDNDEWDIEKLS